MNPEHPAHGEVKVSQAAREAAADFIRAWTNTEDVDCYPSHTDSIWTREGRADGELLVQAFARFEQSLTTPPASKLKITKAKPVVFEPDDEVPPATDVALREAIGRVQKLADTREAGVQRDARHRGSNPDPAYHRSHATVASVSLIDLQTLLAALSAPTPPDQPQIGDEATEQAVFKAIYETLDLSHELKADMAECGNLHAVTRAAIAAMPKEDIWEEAARIAEAAKDGIGSPYRSGGSFGAARANQCDIIAAALRDRRAK